MDIQKKLSEIKDQYLELTGCDAEFLISYKPVKDSPRINTNLEVRSCNEVINTAEGKYIHISVEGSDLMACIREAKGKLSYIQIKRHCELLKQVTILINNSELSSDTDPLMIHCPYCDKMAIKVFGTPHGEDMYVHKIKPFNPATDTDGGVEVDGYLEERCLGSEQSS